MWYNDFPRLVERITELKDQFEARCKELGRPPEIILDEFRPAFLAKAVYESNWQEGLKLEAGKTQRFSEKAMEDLEGLTGPAADIDSILKSHQKEVRNLFRNGATVEEVGAYNLSVAHEAILIIENELLNKQIAAATKHLIGALKKGSLSSEQAKFAKEFVHKFTTDPNVTAVPLKGGPKTKGQWACELLELNPESLLNPFKCSYLHFLHRLTMTGMLPPKECGAFRKEAVNVGNPDLIFPPPSAIPAMMEQYCRTFPHTWNPATTSQDRILIAAKFSHRFVHIHPYSDGNGRVSRLLMNLLLSDLSPTFPVFLKADKKGRHRYSQALKRADRGNPEPFAALIAGSIVEMYERIIESISR